jgi:opacity protein-like surface antigen
MRTRDPFRARVRAWTLALALAGLTAAGPARAQVAASADAGGTRLSAGVEGSAFNLGYGNVKVAGGAVFVDADTLRHFGFEGEVRLLPVHIDNTLKQTLYKKEKITTYLGGPRYFRTVGRFQPYAKCLFGLGQFTYPYAYATDNDLVIEPGGGVDYRLSRRVKVRAEVDYQMWPQFHFGQLNNVGVSVGFRFRIR